MHAHAAHACSCGSDIGHGSFDRHLFTCIFGPVTVLYRDRVRLSLHKIRAAYDRGGESDRDLLADDLSVLAVCHDQHRIIRGHFIRNIDKDVLFGRRIHRFHHGAACAGDHDAAVDQASTSVLASEVKTVVASVPVHADDDHSPVDHNISVGIQSVSIHAVLIDDRDRSSVDRDERRFLLGCNRFILLCFIRFFCSRICLDRLCCRRICCRHPASHRTGAGFVFSTVSVDPVIARINGNVASVDGDIHCLDPFIAGFQQDLSVGDVNFRIAVQRVVLCIDGDIRPCDLEAVIYMHPICRGCNVYVSSRDHQVIVRLNTVFVTGLDRERTASVDRQVVMGIDHASGPVLYSLFRVFFTALQDILRIPGKRQKYLVSLIDTDAGVVRTADVHAVQQDPCLSPLLIVNDDASVIQIPADHILSGRRDHQIPVEKIRAVSADCSVVSFQCDPDGRRSVPAAVQVILRKPDLALITFRICVYGL